LETKVKRSPAPDAELVRAFVNTFDLEDRVDVLDRAWLADRALLGHGDEMDAADLAELATVREAIRDLLAANNAVAVDAGAAAATLDDAARRCSLTVRFRHDGTAALEAAGRGGSARAVGRVLAAVASLMAIGAWSRLKACRAGDCRWAFFDETRNRSRAWCSMAACGNRAKARAFRARRS
jgi:predicted RNA-binding Zn ribbon-like protein